MHPTTLALIILAGLTAAAMTMETRRPPRKPPWKNELTSAALDGGSARGPHRATV